MSSPTGAYSQQSESVDHCIACSVELSAVHSAHLLPESPDEKPCAPVDSGELKVIAAVIDRLAGTNPNVADTKVADIVNASYARFDGRPIRDYVPLLVERDARAQLAGMGG
jgi:hypothetical protein